MTRLNPHGRGYSPPADRYHHDVHAAAVAGVSPEARLAAPVGALFRAVAAEAGLGELTLLPVPCTGRTRPDFGVLHRRGHRTFQRGYIALRAPSASVDSRAGKDRDDRQMAVEAEVLIVCDGRAARLYVDGEPQLPDAPLPYEDPAAWDGATLADLLRRFLRARVSPVRSVGELSRRLAYRTADLRDKLLWLLGEPSAAGEMARAQYEGWKTAIHAESSPRDFADGISQVVSYGMVLAALGGAHADADSDGILSVEEARAAIRDTSPVMAAAFGPLLEEPLHDAVRVELGHLEALVSAIDVERVNASSDRRGEPWLHFYEDFLGVYDPDERRQAGVYYTPTAVVKAMVHVVDHLLVERLGRRTGFADPTVVTLDPAVGTGTFPLAVLDAAARRMEALHGPAGRAEAAAHLARNLHGFELLPGPYAVSHLRLTQRLRELDPTASLAAQVMLADTLESPDGVPERPLFGDARVLAVEQQRANEVKARQDVTVVIGNPPYRRLARDVRGRGTGGWIFEPIERSRGEARALFDDLLDVAKAHTIFSHHASLYNLYVYFWRWALWKAFQANGPGDGVVALITGSSWLVGPGFVGLRALVRGACDEAWVLDLGGDNKGAHPEENVFAIETPVAIVVLLRRATHDPGAPATIHYRRISGTRDEKLAQLEAIGTSDTPLAGAWDDVPRGLHDRLVPTRGDDAWGRHPKLADLFPCQQPGCKVGRTWPIAPSADVLRARWSRLVASSPEERPGLFATSAFGRDIHTEVAGLRRLADERADAAPQPLRRYGYRSFDRQWTLQDPRLAALERPWLWRASSPRQVYFASMMTGELAPGPALTVSDAVPDLHYFCGRGGKDILPLWRDAASTDPNVTRGLLAALGERLGVPTPSPEHLAAYVYALLSSPAYQARFRDALTTPGPRVPLTADPARWAEAVGLGEELLWLHTWGERFHGPGRGRFVPRVPGLGWSKAVVTMPESLDDVRWADGRLYVGDGVVDGVIAEVWGYSVSKMPVLKKWLGYRTARGTGRAASSKNALDQLRPTSWPDEWSDELLDLLRILTLTVRRQPAQAALLARICDGATIDAAELPTPEAAEREPPVRE